MKVRELIRELANHEMDETGIQSVIMFLKTEKNFKMMTNWLREVEKPTKNDIMLKAFLISEKE